MDILADSSEALESYIEASTGADRGQVYLFAFGALQALDVQQDAVFWLLRSIKYPSDVTTFAQPGKWIGERTNLNDARNLRNRSIGHPARSDKGRSRVPRSLCRAVSPHDVSDYSATPTMQRRSMRYIDVWELIEKQAADLTAILANALGEARAAQQEHREKDMGQRLQSIFDSLDYPLEKLSEATHAVPEMRPLGLYGIERVESALQAFRDQLQTRGEPFDAGLKLMYQRIEVALRSLRPFFEGRPEPTPEMADVLAESVSDRIEELRDWAAEIDNKYSDPS